MNLTNYYNNILNKNINTHDNQVDKILGLLKNNIPFAFARFNDGEMMGIDKIGAIAARGHQKVNESLHNALKEAIQYKQKNYFVGLPCSECFPQYHSLAKSLIKQPKEFHLNAVAMTNRNWIKFIVEFPKVVKNRQIIWLSGDDQDLNFLTEGMNLNIDGQYLYPSRDSWKHYSKLKNEPADNDDIIMVSLGPTARVYVREMFEKYPDKTFIDIGSTFDPFTRNVWHNCHKGWIEKGKNNTKECKICN